MKLFYPLLWQVFLLGPTYLRFRACRRKFDPYRQRLDGIF